MKRQITLSLLLAAGVLLLSAKFVPTTQGQQPLPETQSQQPPAEWIPVADTGIITLSRNQMLRLTVTGDWDAGGDASAAEVFFKRLEYMQSGGNDGVRKTALAIQTASDPITLASGEDALFDVQNVAFGVRGVVFSTRPDVRVTAQIINRKTGDVQAFSGLVGTTGISVNQDLVTQARRRRVTVVGRINQATLTAPQIQTLLSIPRFSTAVAVQGNIVIPAAGNSLWLLSNGGYGLVVAGEVLETTAYASEIWTKDMGNGDLYVAACFCPGATANPNDGCAFDGPAARQNCKGPACCGFKDGIILGNGTPQLF